MSSLDLDTRRGLPEALLVLLRDHPRSGWSADRNFAGLVAFWLGRHQMFRDLQGRMSQEAQALLDGKVDPKSFGTRLSRLGGQFVGELHGHHQIEDQHYFPALARAEPRIERGFVLLEKDHLALDAHLHRFVESGNAALDALMQRNDPLSPAGRFLDELARLQRLLDRHLTDEEDLIVPVILRHGPDAIG
jgi:iron-sulfur cluster repair protein YtfE (RIC family)